MTKKIITDIQDVHVGDMVFLDGLEGPQEVRNRQGSNPSLYVEASVPPEVDRIERLLYGGKHTVSGHCFWISDELFLRAEREVETPTVSETKVAAATKAIKEYFEADGSRLSLNAAADMAVAALTAAEVVSE
jgi:hypothetical protein